MEQNLTEKQEGIICAALAIINREGMKAITFSRIAKELGVTEPAIYRHFEGKKEFIKSLYLYARSRIAKKILSDLEVETPEQKIKSLFRAVFEHLDAVKGVNIILLAHAIVENDSELKELMFTICRSLTGELEEIIREGMEQGEFRADLDSDLMAGCFLGLVQGRVVDYYLSGQKCSLSDQWPPIYDFFIRGLKS